MYHIDKTPISTVGDCSWWNRVFQNDDSIAVATQQQCQSGSCGGNGGCSCKRIGPLPPRTT